MTSRNSKSFRNSELDRVKPQRHFFRSLINNNLKRHRSDIGLVEDRTSSTTVIRIIVALLLLHLIVIGGVILRGKMISADSIGVAPAITPPPAAPVQKTVEVLPQPVDGPTANPVRTANHITQAPIIEPVEVENAEEIEVVTPPIADPADVSTTPDTVSEVSTVPTPEPSTAAPMVNAKHLVASGETLYSISVKHGVAISAIRNANPQLRGNNIISGTYLNIPVRADSEAGRTAAARTDALTAIPSTYTIQKGDTLARIAKKHKISTAKLMKINNLTEKDARRIKPGDKLKISE